MRLDVLAMVVFGGMALGGGTAWAKIVPGPGNPAVSKHPMTKEQCQAKLNKLGVNYKNPAFEKICGGPYMAPLYDPKTQKPQDAKACIDQFEFPDVPCEYPTVWVKAAEAAALCESKGKRLCDAHEWEGACAGQLLPPDYAFDTFVGASAAAKIKGRRAAKNAKENHQKVWAYGPTRQKGICGMGSFKSAGCNGGSWSGCGSNTYPAGAFPQCKSKLEVYDQHGNAAEHMNLPTEPSEMASLGSQTLGHTEMKGSWFIFDSFYAHPDHCRWRAPYWHGSRVRSASSHMNYHLGFRCCKSL